jgi:plasmid maintenance system antidote protein VapI
MTTKRKTKTGPETLSDQLRRIIADSGLSRYAICKAAQVDPAHLHRFVNDRPGGRITNDTLDRLGAALRLRLVQDADE